MRERERDVKVLSEMRFVNFANLSIQPIFVLKLLNTQSPGAKGDIIILLLEVGSVV